MRDPSDVWYVRLPDGRIVRAKSTNSVRHHIENGRIPVDCWVRRSGEDDWTTLDWTVEFSDLVAEKRKRPTATEEPRPREVEIAVPAKSNGSSVRGNGNELRTVGVRGLAEELLAALDSTLNRKKLWIALCACFLGGGVAMVLHALPLGRDVQAAWLGWVGAGLGFLVIVGLSAALITRMTFVELSRLRPARWGEVVVGLEHHALQVMAVYLLSVGSVLLATAGLRELPAWILENDLEGFLASEAFAGCATIAALVLEVLLWPVLGLAMLLPPIVIIEECGVLGAIRQWWALIRRHLSRVFLYEALATALGALMSLPFLFPILLAGLFSNHGPAQAEFAWGTLAILSACAATPLVAYMLVANVFIYLNLRYELSGRS
jgi:hypothetical protein